MNSKKACNSAGIDTALPLIDKNNNYLDGFLYYGNASLTDKPYIKFPYLYLNGNFFNYGNHIVQCYGRAKKGDYISTFFLYGVAFSSGQEFEEPSFAIALENKESEGIGGLLVKFLQQPNKIQL